MKTAQCLSCHFVLAILKLADINYFIVFTKLLLFLHQQPLSYPQLQIKQTNMKAAADVVPYAPCCNRQLVSVLTFIQTHKQIFHVKIMFISKANGVVKESQLEIIHFCLMNLKQ